MFYWGLLIVLFKKKKSLLLMTLLGAWSVLQRRWQWGDRVTVTWTGFLHPSGADTGYGVDEFAHRSCPVSLSAASFPRRGNSRDERCFRWKVKWSKWRKHCACWETRGETDRGWNDGLLYFSGHRPCSLLADLFLPYLIGLSWISLYCCAVK